MPFSPTMMSEPVVREVARASCNGGKISCGDEATSVADRRGSYLDIIRGQRLGSLPVGFLVNFLRKENWNVGTAETLSKYGLLRFRLTFV